MAHSIAQEITQSLNTSTMQTIAKTLDAALRKAGSKSSLYNPALLLFLAACGGGGGGMSLR